MSMHNTPFSGMRRIWSINDACLCSRLAAGRLNYSENIEYRRSSRIGAGQSDGGVLRLRQTVRIEKDEHVIESASEGLDIIYSFAVVRRCNMR